VKNSKSIWVADRDYFPLLFRYKNAHPELRIKIITKEELLDLSSFTYKNGPLPLLLKRKDMDYSSAKKWMKLLRVADFYKNKTLLELYGLLKEDYLQEDELGRYELDSCDLFLFEMPEDFEIQSLLSRKKISFKELSFQDLSIEKVNDDVSSIDIIPFKDKYQQFTYIYSDIRRRLLDNPDEKDKIKVLIKDDDDLFYVNAASSLFNVPSYAIYKKPFLSNRTLAEKIKQIHQERSLSFTEEELEDDSLKELKRVIDYYELDTIDFDKAYADLLEIVKGNNSSKSLGDKGITVTDSFSMNQNSIIYVTDFHYDVFYKVYKDNNVLSDEQLEKCGTNTSYFQTKLEKRKKLNYLLYNHILLLSFVEQHQADHIYLSQFIEGEDDKLKKLVRNPINRNGVYTDRSKKLFVCDQYDRNFWLFSDGEVRTYDHSFKGLKTYISKRKDVWSVSALKSYVCCPFKFFLEETLPKTETDYHPIILGNLIHGIMEEAYHKDFDFDKSFEYRKAFYLDEMKKYNIPDNGKEQLTLSLVYMWLRRILSVTNTWKDNSHIIKDYSEQKITWDIKDGDCTYHFTGRIDKIVETKDCDSRKYYYLIDYKTGKAQFDIKSVCAGSSVQLPLYYYAFENSEDKMKLVDNASFGGFGIQRIFFNTPKDAYGSKAKSIQSTDSLLENTKITGCLAYDTSLYHSIDETLELKGKTEKEPKSKYVSGKNSFKGSEQAFAWLKKSSITYTLKDLVDDAINSCLENIRSIKAAKFPISPTSFIPSQKPTKLNLVCSSCIYNDICYHKESDIRSSVSKIDEHFNPKAKEN